MCLLPGLVEKAKESTEKLDSIFIGLPTVNKVRHQGIYQTDFVDKLTYSRKGVLGAGKAQKEQVIVRREKLYDEEAAAVVELCN